MYLYNSINTPSYTTSTANMYNKHFTYPHQVTAVQPQPCKEPALMQEGDDANGTGHAVWVVGVGVLQQGQQRVDGVVMQVGVAVQDGLVPGDHPSNISQIEKEKTLVVIRLVLVFNT